MRRSSGNFCLLTVDANNIFGRLYFSALRGSEITGAAGELDEPLVMALVSVWPLASHPLPAPG